MTSNPMDEVYREVLNLNHPNGQDLTRFLETPELIQPINDFFNRLTLTDTIVFIDGFNLGNNVEFFNNILAQSDNFRLLNDVRNGCFSQMPENFSQSTESVISFLDGNISAITRQEKFNLSLCFLTFLSRFLVPGFKIVAIFGDDTTETDEIGAIYYDREISPNLLGIVINGMRVPPLQVLRTAQGPTRRPGPSPGLWKMEADDLLLLYLWQGTRRLEYQTMIVSNDRYRFLAQKWRRHREKDDAKIVYFQQNPEQWTFEYNKRRQRR